MKKQLSLVTNQHGFFLPYVLFFTGLVFIIVTASVSIYKQDITLTHQLVEQTKIKTLEQMGRASFKENLSGMTSPTGTVNYSFPDGKVKIIYEVLKKERIELYFSIHTNEDAEYTYNRTQMLSPKKNIKGKNNIKKQRGK